MKIIKNIDDYKFRHRLQEIQELNDLQYHCDDIFRMLTIAGYDDDLDMPFEEFKKYFKKYVKRIPDGSFDSDFEEEVVSPVAPTASSGHPAHQSVSQAP